MIIFFSGIRSGFFFLSRSQYTILGTGIIGKIASFERRLGGGGSNARRPAVSVPHLDENGDRRWARQPRSAFFLAVYARAILGSWHITKKAKGQHFQIGIISKLESKFLPDIAFFMWRPRSACPIVYSYYHCCCVSLPFGSVGIVLCNQRRMCREYDSHPNHIWYAGACPLETLWMVMIPRSC